MVHMTTSIVTIPVFPQCTIVVSRLFSIIPSAPSRRIPKSCLKAHSVYEIDHGTEGRSQKEGGA